MNIIKVTGQGREAGIFIKIEQARHLKCCERIGKVCVSPDQDTLQGYGEMYGILPGNQELWTGT